MPYHLEFDSEHKILVLVVEGVADDAGVMTANQAIAAQVDRLQPSAGISAHPLEAESGPKHAGSTRDPWRHGSTQVQTA